MLVYLFMLSPLVLYSLMWRRNIYKTRDLIIFSIIIFILAFNYQMGVDWLSYQTLYESISLKTSLVNTWINNSRIEKGYIWYNYIIKNYLGFNYNLFMGLTLSSCIYLLLKKVKKESQNYYLAIFIYITKYLFVNSMEPVVRELIAIVIINFGLKYIEEKNFVKYFLIVLLASQFHSSAIVCIIFYFLDKINLSLKTVIILFIIMFVVVFKIELVFNLISKIFRSIGNYNLYISKFKFQILSNLKIKALIFKSFQSSIYLYIIFFGYNNFIKRKKYIKNTAILSIILSYFVMFFPPLYRLRDYFIMFFVIAISSVVNIKTLSGKKINKKIKKILVFYLILTNGLLFFRQITINDLNIYKFFPYKNYFIEYIKGETYLNNDQKMNNYLKETKNLRKIKRRNFYD